MSLVINSNISSLNAQRNLSKTQSALQTSLQRLSSGLRINSAADDAAGLAISSTMNAQVRGMNQAIRNANDGISLVQTADGALNEISNILVRMRELAVQSANGTLNDTNGDRDYIDGEFTKMSEEIDRIAAATSFNGQFLLNAGDTFTIQVGAMNTADDQIDIVTTDVSGLTYGSVDTQANAQTAIDNMDTAMTTVNTLRGDLGAYQNRLTSTINNLQVGVENTSAAASRITDVDVAAETSAMTRASILSQAGISILAQANSAPQAALKLLQ